MMTNREILLDEIKRMHSDMPKVLRQMLSKFQDEDILLQVKETMRKDGDKYHFFIENDEFIVSGGKSGEQFSLLVRLENGDESIVSQSGARSSYVYRGNDGNNVVVQSNGEESRFVVSGDNGSMFVGDDKRSVWQTPDGVQISADRHGNTSISADGVAANIEKNKGNLVDWSDGNGTHSFSWDLGKGEDIIVEDFELEADLRERGNVQVGFRNGALCSIKQDIGDGKETYNLQYKKDKVVYEATVSEETEKVRERLEVFEGGLEYSFETQTGDKSVSTEKLSLDGELLDGKDGTLSFVKEEKEDGKSVYKKTVSCKKAEDAFYSKTEELVNGVKIKMTFMENDNKSVTVGEVEGDYYETKMKKKYKIVDGVLVSRQYWEDGKCVFEYDENKGIEGKKSEKMDAWLKSIPEGERFDERDICQLVGGLNTEIHDFEMKGYKRKGNNIEAYKLDVCASDLELRGDLSSIVTNFCGNLAVGGIPFEVDGKEQNNQHDESGKVVLHTDDGYLYYKGSVEGFSEFLAKVDGEKKIDAEAEMLRDKLLGEGIKKVSPAAFVFKNRSCGR